ncbi:MAG: EamA family transporter [Actinomycetota bacterium]
MEIVLALGSALAYGVSDFTGGVLTKKTHVFTVILLSQLVSSAILIFALPFWDGSFSWRAVQWGTVAGVAGMAGAALLYRGLAIGRMGVVAPITAVLAAAIPLSFALAVGERPGSMALIGVVLGLVAVVLISSSPEPDSAAAAPETAPLASMRAGGRGIVEALGAGTGFGLFFILLERTPGESGLWPLVGTRVSMVAFVALLAAVAGVSVRPSARIAHSLILLGVINLGADLLFLLATRTGLLSLVAVITSLYPAATVALARVFLAERMVQQQLLGVVCAAVSVTLIALR